MYHSIAPKRPPRSERGNQEAFWEAVQADPALLETIQAAVDAEAVLAIAREAGFVLAAEDLMMPEAEVSEEQLRSVVAGSAGRPQGAVQGLKWLLTNQFGVDYSEVSNF